MKRIEGGDTNIESANGKFIRQDKFKTFGCTIVIIFLSISFTVCFVALKNRN